MNWNQPSLIVHAWDDPNEPIAVLKKEALCSVQFKTLEEGARIDQCKTCCAIFATAALQRQRTAGQRSTCPICKSCEADDKTLIFRRGILQIAKDGGK